MEIVFENRESLFYREYCHQVRRTQESVECVVPDTDTDIEKIAAVQSGVFLKSKDLSAHGVIISGELYASVLYIRDGQAGVSSIRVRRPFTLEYEVDAPESDTLAQITLLIQGTDVRVINPRKISVCFDVEGELSCYRSEGLCTEAVVPDNIPGLHVKTESYTLFLPNAVCEKSFSLNEQFAFSAGVDAAVRLLSEKAELYISDCQLLGSKLIVKGNAAVTVCSQGDADASPAVSSFSVPFSQIVEVGVENIQNCSVRPEITGAYFDLIDTINGEKALDMELHAVLQVVGSEDCTISCITDAYSNLMPGELISRTQEFAVLSAAASEKLHAEERLGLMEKCRELLNVFASISRLSTEGEKVSAAVTLDFLFLNDEEKLSACRRTVALSDETTGKQLRILQIASVQCSAKPDGEYVDCSISLDLECIDCVKESTVSVGGIVLDEEKAYVQGSLPTLTLVRREGESLWSLAKRYHSSEEKIRELNEDAENCSRMLLIPKCT